jgi:hypothetical protein
MGKTSNVSSSRREFLKKSLKVAGYSIPAMMAISSVSLDAFACRYGRKPSCGTIPNQRYITIVRRYLRTHPEMLNYLRQHHPYLLRLIRRYNRG